MNVFERLKYIVSGPGYQEISAPSDSASDGYPLDFQEAMDIYQRLAGEAAQTPQRTLDLEPSLPTLRSLYEGGTILADPTKIVAGVTREWQPVELDLRNGDGTSVLMVSDNIENTRAVIRTMIDSMIYNNSPHVVRYVLITNKPGDYPANDRQAVLGRLHKHTKIAPYETQFRDLIQELAETTEQRRSGRQTGPSVVIFIDDLVQASEQLGEMGDLFIWLVNHGPKSGIWTVASLRASEADSKFDDVYAAFGSVILGQTRGSRNSAYIEKWLKFARQTCTDPSGLREGQFIGNPPSNEWFAFRPLG